MKCILIVVVALAALIAADEKVPDKSDYHNAHDDCLREAGVTPEQNAKINALETPDDKEVQDFVLCKATRTGIFNREKGFDVDRLFELFSKYTSAEEARAIALECADKNEQQSPLPVWAWRGHACMRRHKNELDRRSKANA